MSYGHGVLSVKDKALKEDMGFLNVLASINQYQARTRIIQHRDACDGKQVYLGIAVYLSALSDTSILKCLQFVGLD